MAQSAGVQFPPHLSDQTCSASSPSAPTTSSGSFRLAQSFAVGHRRFGRRVRLGSVRLCRVHIACGVSCSRVGATHGVAAHYACRCRAVVCGVCSRSARSGAPLHYLSSRARGLAFLLRCRHSFSRRRLSRSSAPHHVRVCSAPSQLGRNRRTMRCSEQAPRSRHLRPTTTTFPHTGRCRARSACR